MTYDTMIDTDHGMISREIFSAKAVFDDELEKVFTRAWLFVGHESQVPNPGDYFTSRMGTESVILARDKGLSVRPRQYAAVHMSVSQLELHH
jgi:phenylpropionate dioxygenase-like ring-hydroxylating dioxygenase large terminal subunit